ncbi:uncharacterized protein LOC136037204 [Artemia franciscana]|uniref:Major facilitator superfamily associated domain-containing protein n=1 Tax=Artemia franciscana TaxID=6661 RepID=A0AA88I3A8_ARTSF|nr:hypothetical protein QYM36_004982 [Artemia franciscana]
MDFFKRSDNTKNEKKKTEKKLEKKKAETGEKDEINDKGKQGKNKVKVTGWARIKKDFLVREFWPLKPLFFLLFSSIVALLPFMTLHMRMLGITDEETGYIMAMFAIFSLLTPFIFTTIADKVGNFKWLLFGLLIATAVNGLFFLAIPKGRLITKMPQNISFDAPCSADFPLFFDNSVEHCNLNIYDNATLEFGACGYECDFFLMEDTLETMKLVNETLKRKSIFYKDLKDVGLFCSGDFCEVRSTAEEGLTPWKANNLTMFDNGGRIEIETFIFNNQSYTNFSLKCSPELAPSLQNLLNQARCRRKCFIEGARSQFCSNPNWIVDLGASNTFWWYTVTRVAFAITLGGSMILFEGAAMSVITEYKGDIALQRVFGIFGAMGFAAFSGWTIDKASEGLPDKDFTPAFYMYSIMMGLGAFLVLLVNLDIKPPATHFLQDVKLLISKVEMIALIVATIFSGTFWGYFETFIFWFLEDLGGSNLLMGLTITVSGASGIPFLLLFEPLWKKIGLINIYVIGFIVYIFRFVGYVYLENPWVCLVYEAMEAVTTQLMTTCMVQYAANLATQTTMATAQGLVSKSYYALGRALGSVIGGKLIGTIGHRNTFKVMAVASAFSAVAYFLFQELYLKRTKKDGNRTETADENKGCENPVFEEQNDENEDTLKKVADEMINKLGVDYEYGTGIDNPALDDIEKESAVPGILSDKA